MLHVLPAQGTLTEGQQQGSHSHFNTAVLPTVQLLNSQNGLG